MLNFLKFKSSTFTAGAASGLPNPPFQKVVVLGTDATVTSISRGQMLLWTYLRTLAEVCKTPLKDGTVSITVIYDHFLNYFDLTTQDVTRRQFGVEFHRWVREKHLPLRVTKPRSSAIHVEGIDSTVLATAFQN